LANGPAADVTRAPGTPPEARRRFDANYRSRESSFAMRTFLWLIVPVTAMLSVLKQMVHVMTIVIYRAKTELLVLASPRCSNPLKTERRSDKEETESRGVGGGAGIISPVLNVPRQRSLA
jgi:hypothetical protein